MRLPEKLYVGHRTYTVRRPNKAWSKRHSVYGECDTVTATLRVARGYDDQSTANTFLHEAMHALWDAYGLSFGKTGPSEERVVTVMANAMCDLIARNPEILDVLREGLQQEECGG